MNQVDNNQTKNVQICLITRRQAKELVEAGKTSGEV